ncbi:tetratricopeptide repeat protein [Streptomyces sp. NPDC050504]|uniref:tetratricopeptide repeat protein n=1 Tax=Streptomyces sp. NPDC050504 TaxID=3365618 RepID=UPI0037B4CAC9
MASLALAHLPAPPPDRSLSALNARADLAASYRDAGRTGEALRLEEQILADSECLLGSKHPDTLTARGEPDTGRAESRRSRGSSPSTRRSQPMRFTPEEEPSTEPYDAFPVPDPYAASRKTSKASSRC